MICLFLVQNNSAVSEHRLQQEIAEERLRSDADHRHTQSCTSGAG